MTPDREPLLGDVLATLAEIACAEETKLAEYRGPNWIGVSPRDLDIIEWRVRCLRAARAELQGSLILT